MFDLASYLFGLGALCGVAVLTWLISIQRNAAQGANHIPNAYYT